MALIEQKFHKDGHERTVFTPGEAIQLRNAGWVEVEVVEETKPETDAKPEGPETKSEKDKL